MNSLNEIWEGFIYNLNCYDDNIISKEDFKQAMEEYIYGRVEKIT